MQNVKATVQKNFLKAKSEFSAGNYDEAYKTLETSLGENDLSDEYLKLLQDTINARNEARINKLDQYMQMGKEAFTNELYQDAYFAFDQASKLGDSIENLSPMQANEILKLKSESKIKTDENKSILKRAEESLELGECPEALDLLSKLKNDQGEQIRQKIKDLEHAISKGQKALEKKQFKDAITQFRHAKEISPKDDSLEQYLKNAKYELSMQEGNSKYEKKDYRLAFKFFKEALEISPDAESAKQMKDKAQSKLDGIEKAQQLVNIAKSAKNQGDLLQAVQLLMTALRYDPDSESANNLYNEIERDSQYAILIYKSQECLRDGDYSGAIKNLSQIHASPNPSEIQIQIEKVSQIQQLEEAAKTAIGTQAYKHAMKNYEEIKNIFLEYLKINNVPRIEIKIDELREKRSEYVSYLVEELAKQRDAKDIEGAYITAEKIRSVDENNLANVQLMDDIIREINKKRMRSSFVQPLNRMEILLGVFTLVLGIILLLMWLNIL